MVEILFCPLSEQTLQMLALFPPPLAIKSDTRRVNIPFPNVSFKKVETTVLALFKKLEVFSYSLQLTKRLHKMYRIGMVSVTDIF